MSDFFNRNGTMMQMAELASAVRSGANSGQTGWFKRFGSILGSLIGFL